MSLRLLILSLAAFAFVHSTLAQTRLPSQIREKLRLSTAYIRTQNVETGGTGSGFVVKVEGKTAYVATNNHVIDPKSEGVDIKAERTHLSVVFDSESRDAKPIKAKLLAADKEHDLAILQVDMDTTPPPAFTLYSKAKLEETLPMTVFGFPLGDTAITINSGEVSGFRHDDLGHMARVKLFAKVDPGNSGGPVVDNSGAIIGVTVEKDRRADNIAYAIPAFELHQLLRGRLGNFDVKQKGDGTKYTLTLKADRLDPFKKLKKVTVYDIAAKDLAKDAMKKAVSENGSAWKLLSPKMRKQSLPVTDDKVEMSIEVEGASGESHYLQLSYEREGEKGWITDPLEVFLGGKPPKSGDKGNRKIPLPEAGTLNLAGEKKKARGIDATELTINAGDALPQMFWDKDHVVLYVVERSGKTRKIDAPRYQQDAHIDLGFPCKAAALSGEGICVLSEDKPELWVIDQHNLEVLRVIDVPGAANFAVSPSSFYGFVANAAGDLIQAYDLVEGTVSKEWKISDVGDATTPGGTKPSKFGPAKITADGRYLISTSDGALHRFGLKDATLTYEQSGPVFSPNAEQVELSTDGLYVSLPSPTGHQAIPGHELGPNGLYLFKTSDLALPAISVKTGQPTPVLVAASASSSLYGTFKNTPLVVFDIQGQIVREFPELTGEFARQILPYHRARGVLLVLTDQKLYLVRNQIR